MRSYTYSGRYVGINGGNTRVFTDPRTQKLMVNTRSGYVDHDGNTTGIKRKEYQGKYPEWFERAKDHGQGNSFTLDWESGDDDGDVNDEPQKNLDNKGKSLRV